MAAVQRTGAEIGLALDGDGDRLGVVTRGGGIVWPDRQMVLFAREVLARRPGVPILFDAKSTQRLGPAIREAGGEPVLCKSGYTLLKARMSYDGTGAAARRLDARGLSPTSRAKEISCTTDTPPASRPAMPAPPNATTAPLPACGRTT